MVLYSSHAPVLGRRRRTKRHEGGSRRAKVGYGRALPVVVDTTAADAASRRPVAVFDLRQLPRVVVQLHASLVKRGHTCKTIV